MRQPESLDFLTADRPRTNPNEDRLGFSVFAKRLAEAVCRMPSAEGFVVALNGPWGSGKSTLLNFVEYFFNHELKQEAPIILRFNPWTFPSRDHLTRSLLGQLLALSKTQTALAGVRKGLARLAAAYAESSMPYSASAKAAAAILKEETPDLPKLKQQVIKTFGRIERRILVIVDDLDRLAADEIRDIFRVIKGVADLPNVIYLLAFDRTIVVEALESLGAGSGENYLEKIVQAPFELPEPEPRAIQQMFLEGLDGILGIIPPESFDKERWTELFISGIEPFIRTPRQAARLLNALTVTYPAIAGEVNAVDFVALETLRVFLPRVYQSVRENINDFQGNPTSFVPSDLRAKKPSDSIEATFQLAPSERRETTKELLMQLFPSAPISKQDAFLVGTSDVGARREMRVCSPERAPVYFRFSLPSSLLSDQEMRRILESAREPALFADELVQLTAQSLVDERRKIDLFLGQCNDYLDHEVPVLHAGSIIKALLDVGDQLLEPGRGRRDILEIGNDHKIGHIILRLINRVTKAQRFPIMEEAITEGHALQTICDTLMNCGMQQGRHGSTKPAPEEHWLLNAHEMDKLEKLGLEKIRAAARENRLLGVRDLQNVLCCWHFWGNPTERKDWIREIIKTDESLAAILVAFARFPLVQRGAKGVPKIVPRLDPKDIREDFDPDAVIDRVRRIAESSTCTEDQRAVSRAFVRRYDLRKEGLDPDDPRIELAES